MESEILFCCDNQKWVMKLTKKGVFFNREDFPNASASSFAQAIVEILEKEFSVTFHKKIPPYDKTI